jgi:hypothetical protein
MATMLDSSLGLVPQRRLGALLGDRREMYGYTVADMALRSSGRFTPRELESIEAGTVPLDDATVEALGLLYEFNSTPPTYQRSKLIIADDEDMPVPVPHDQFSDDLRTSVLQRYVALLYLLRSAEVGDMLRLRVEDVTTLSEAFDLTGQEVMELVETLMRDDTTAVGALSDRMRRRLVVPAAGLLVGPTPKGMLVLVK